MYELILPILVGWALGYMVNYLAYVLPITRRLSAPVCPNCGHRLTKIGFLFGIRCVNCRKFRFLRLWLVNIFMAITSAYIWLEPPHKLGYVLGLVLISYFATIFVIDMEHRLILHPTSVVGLFVAVSCGWLSHGLIPTLIGGTAGFSLMLVLYYFGVLFSRFRTRKLESTGVAPDGEEALGAGDVILAGILGLALGWPLIWFGLLSGILLAGIFGVLLLITMTIRRQVKKSALMVFMPYGPFFVLSTFLIIFVPGLVVRVVPN